MAVGACDPAGLTWGGLGGRARHLQEGRHEAGSSTVPHSPSPTQGPSRPCLTWEQSVASSWK